MMFKNKQERFGIRKYKSLGAASAVIGALVFSSAYSGGDIASAHEGDAPVVEKNNSAPNDIQSESKVSVEPKTAIEPKEVTIQSENKVSVEPKEVIIQSESKVSVEPKSATEDVSANSSDQPSTSTRSRRSKRDTSSEANTVYVPRLGKDNEIPMNVSNITEVSKIDYTNSKNPSPESENSKGIYNNQIQSIEEIPALNTGSKRIRVTLKDGMSIPDGGSIVLATLGGSSPISKDLIKNSETIGTVRRAELAYDDPKGMRYKLQNAKTVDEYVRLFENLTSSQLPVRSYTLTFNSNFSKLNLNRVVEFEIEDDRLELIDYSLIRTREAEVGDKVVIDSKGMNHTLRKDLISYLLNPYDSKSISLGSKSVYIDFVKRPKVTPISNELTLSSGYGNPSKPSYFDTLYTPSFGSIRVNNRDKNADSVVASKGDTFKFELSDNSLFATSDYSVGDIVSFNSYDKVLKESTISGNRFTDTDKYITIQKPSTDASSDVKVSYRFKLVEKTDKTYKWELLDNISLTNSEFYEDLYKLTPVSLRKDWVSRFGEDNLKNYLNGNEKYADKYLTNSQLKGKAITNIKGVTNEVPLKGLIIKNTNLIAGENSTGTVKVIHKTDTGAILSEETVANNQPWYQPLNIDPKTTFTDYVFKSASETLSTIVGTGNRTIELIYTQPKTTTKEIPPKVTYVVDNSKEGTYRNEVAGKPTIETTNTTYIYDETTRTASEKVTKSTVEGTPTVVTLGTKPKTEVTYQDFSTRYVADPNRVAGEKFTETEGVRGTTTTITTYSVNTDTGVVTPIKGEPQVVAPIDKVVKVGTKSIPIETHTPIEVVYKADRTIEKGQEVIESQGRLGVKIVTTPKILNINDGTVSDGTPVIEETVMEPKVIKVGAKDKVVTEVIEPTVTYTGDKTKVVGSENVTEAGTKGSKVTTTTYTVNEKTGEVIPHVGEPVITKAGTTVVKVGAQDKVTYKKQGNDVVKVTTSYEVDSKTGKLTKKTTESVHAKDGAKDKVVTEVIEPTVEYVSDDSREKGTPNEEIKGNKGSKVRRITYSVNPNTGEVSEIADKVEMIPAGKTIVKVGTKSKYVTKELEPTVEYVNDESREKGTPNEEIKGNKGVVVVISTYKVNPKTGEITETVGELVVVTPGKTIIKVGAKEPVVKFVPNEAPVVEVPEFKGGVRPSEAPKVEVPEFKGGVTPNEAPKVEVPEFKGGVTPNEAPKVEVPEFKGGVTPNDAPKVEVPEFKGGVTPNEAPKVEVPEFKGGVTPNDAPKVEVPEFKGGVTPNEAPKVEVPEFKGGVIPNKAQVIESKVNAKLPETGGINTGVHGLLALAAGSLLYAKNRKKEM